MYKKDVNWEKWSVIIAVVGLVVTVFGVSFSCDSCSGCIPAELLPGYVSEDSDPEETVTENDPQEVPEELPTEEEIKEQIQKETGVVWIEDAQFFASHSDNSSEYEFVEVCTTNTGESTAHNLLLDTDVQYLDKGEGQNVQFFLDRKYTSFCAVASVTDAVSASYHEAYASMSLNIYTDDVLVYSGVFRPDSLPEQLEIDCTGVTLLKIQVAVEDEFTGPGNVLYLSAPYHVFLGNAHFKLNQE